ncbi:helix-turn-helix domain-containing protein [Kitasatospora arboriphila]
MALAEVTTEPELLPASLVAETAGLTPEDAEKPWRLLARGPVDEAAADVWRNTSDCVDRLLDNPPSAAGPLPAGTAARLVATTALTVFPTTLMTGDDAPTDGADATPDTVHRAVAFIEANADRDIGLAQIVAAACVTPRALQYAFRRHLDTTPLAYLRRVRLDAAHAELPAADPRTATVTEIAMRWGFAHPGHFAAHYRGAYRSLPSTTLNQHPDRSWALPGAVAP